MKLIIDIPEGALKLLNTKGVDWLDAEHILSAVAKGTPLDSVKTEIEKKYREVEFMDEFSSGYNYAIGEALETLDNIGKVDKSCSTCKNSDDEFSGECYECVKGIFDHYESEDV